jgi:hypothetical protein
MGTADTFQRQANIDLLRGILQQDNDAARQVLLNPEYDAGTFARFARRQHIAGYCYVALMNMGILDLFSPRQAVPMKSGYIEQWSKNEKLMKTTASLHQRLEHAGIDVICLKGPLFASRYYGDIDRRAISDIDILVQPDDTDRADNVLTQAGFVRRSVVLINRPLTVFFTHHFEYRLGEVVVELHWSLARHTAFRLDTESIWRERISMVYGGQPFGVLSEEYELVMQILSIFKDVELGSITMKSFVDLFMLLRQCHDDISWEFFFERRSKEGLRRIALNVLDLVLGLLDGREEFPALACCLDTHSRFVVARSGQQQTELVLDGRLWRQKIWGLRLYAAPWWKCAGWWAVSLPFRLAVYHKA